MTDEQMDARLRAAGERWRAEHATAATVAPATVTEHEPRDIAPAPRRSSHRRRWGLLGSAAAVAAALVIGGTFLLRGAHSGPGPSGDTAALEGHVWLLQGVQGTQSTATLYVDRDGNLVADDECQLIGGKVAIDHNTMTVTDQVRRYKSCTDQYGPGYYEDGAAVLDGAATFGITSDALTITKDSKELRFTLAPQNTPVPTMDFPTIVGTDWLLVSAKNADGQAVSVAGDPKLRVDDSGNLVGTDGCNTIQGTVTMDADRITFGDVGGTERACPGPEGATETAVLAVLQGTARETVVGGELTISKDQAELVYRWQPQDAEATDPASFRDVHWKVADNAGTAVPEGAELYLPSNGRRELGCTGCPAWLIEPGTLRVGDPLSGKPSPLVVLFASSSHVWRIVDGKLYIALNDSQASALVFDKYAPTEPSGVQLVGPTWHLVSIKAGDGRYRNGAPPAENSTLTFTADSFVVDHSCYTHRGDAAIDQATVTFSNAYTTGVRPCPFQPGLDAAQLVDSILTDSVTWSISGDTLTIQHDTVGRLTYSTNATTKNDALAGTDWRLETAVDSSGHEHAADGLRLSVDHGIDSLALLADDGANEINAGVQVSDETMTLRDVAVGGVGGTADDPVRSTVDDVLAEGDVGYRIDGDVLTLTRGAEQLIYKANAGSDPIVGTWLLTTIEHGTGSEATASSASGPGPLTVTADGQVTVAGCPSAHADIRDGQLSFAHHSIDQMPCGGGSLSVSDQKVIFGVLAGTCSYTVDGDRLTISKDGVGAIVLTRA